MKNLYVHHAPGEPTQLAEQDIAPLKDDEILIKTTKSLVSVGTELAWLRENGIRGGSGYASVGEVVDAGKNATRFKRGDRVVTGCNHAQYGVIANNSQAYRLPEGVSDLQATYLALGGVAMYIASRSDISIGRTVIVVGQGTVGQLVNQMARIAGAGLLIGVDTDSRRYKLSRQLGADETIAPNRAELDAALAKRIEEACPPVFIEVTGSPEALGWILENAPLSSRVVVTGTYMKPLTLDVFKPFIERELDVIGAHNPKCPTTPSPYYPHTVNFKQNFVLDCIRRGRLRVDELCDAVLKPADAVKFYNDAIAGRPRPMQPAIDWENGPGAPIS